MQKIILQYNTDTLTRVHKRGSGIHQVNPMPHFAQTQEKLPRQNAMSFTVLHGGLLQRKKRESEIDPLSEIPPIVHDVLNSPGQPLDPVTRGFMEPRFGHDFGNIRVHIDPKAAESARALNALAYTVGQNIAFSENEYAPTTYTGRELLAHELAHTVQQRNASSALPSSASDGVLESSAEVAGYEVANGRPLSTALTATGVGLARAPVPIEAYPDDMLAKALAEVQQRLKDKSYSGRDRDVDLHMALKWEADKRARTAAIAEALATAARIEREEKEADVEAKAEAEKPEPASYRPATLSLLKPDPRFEAQQLDVDEIYAAIDAKKKAEEKAEEKAKQAARQQEDEGRPARLRVVRRYLTLHGVMKRDMADVLTRFLTVNDLRVLRKNGLEAPGFFTRHYADKVIDVIDKIVPRDPMEDSADLEDLQRRAAAYERTAQKIEGLSTEGPHALAGRVWGATVAAVVGKDPLWGSEVGAAFGGLAGARKEVRAWGSMAKPVEEPVLPEPTIVEPAPPWESMPKPGPIEPLVASGEPAPPPAMRLPSAQEQLPSDPTPPNPPVQQRNPPAAPNPPKRVKPRGSTKTQTGATTGRSKSSTRQTKAEKEAKYNDSLDKRIARVRNELSEAKQRTVEYKDVRAAAGEKQKGGPSKAIWNKEEELYVLERARTYPSRTILEQVELVGVKGTNGKVKSSTEIAGEGRTVDFLEIDGGKVLGGEVKSKAELVHSVENLKEPGIEGGFKSTTSKVGQQRTKEELIIDFANTQGGNLIFKGKDVRTGADVTVEVDTNDYRSTVVAYDQIMPN
jgi:hypothetical protein